jgi:hypothetical protein
MIRPDCFCQNFKWKLLELLSCIPISWLIQIPLMLWRYWADNLRLCCSIAPINCCLFVKLCMVCVFGGFRQSLSFNMATWVYCIRQKHCLYFTNILPHSTKYQNHPIMTNLLSETPCLGHTVFFCRKISPKFNGYNIAQILFCLVYMGVLCVNQYLIIMATC